jgi:hypothetical protein
MKHNHKTYFILSANYYMFRHQAILRECYNIKGSQVKHVPRN